MGRGILNFVRRAIQPQDSVLITDEYRAYRAVRSIMPHEVINHPRGFTPLYVAEACYKYNNRRVENVFDKFLKGCFA